MRQASVRGCSKACCFWLFLYTVLSCAGLERLRGCSSMSPISYLDLGPLSCLPPSGPLLSHREIGRFPVGCYFPVLSAYSVYLSARLPLELESGIYSVLDCWDAFFNGKPALSTEVWSSCLHLDLSIPSCLLFDIGESVRVPLCGIVVVQTCLLVLLGTHCAVGDFSTGSRGNRLTDTILLS